MAYEKHTWETGETITAEKLNNLEDGVSGSIEPFVVNISENSNGYILDKTFGEIRVAYESGQPIKLVEYSESIYGNDLYVYYAISIYYNNQNGVNPNSYGQVFYIDSGNNIAYFYAITTTESASSLEDLDLIYPIQLY